MVSRLEQRHPQRRVRLLQRFRHHVAAGHFEEFALETGIGVHHQHVGALLDGLKPHPPLLGGVETDVEASEFHQRRAFAGAEFDAAVRDEIERGDTFGDAGGVVVSGRHQADAMAKPDPFRALRAGGQENLRRRGMRIFFKEVMLDFPSVIDTKSGRPTRPGRGLPGAAGARRRRAMAAAIGARRKCRISWAFPVRRVMKFLIS